MGSSLLYWAHCAGNDKMVIAHASNVRKWRITRKSSPGQNGLVWLTAPHGAGCGHYNTNIDKRLRIQIVQHKKNKEWPARKANQLAA